jgi:hypothetical protein
MDIDLRLIYRLIPKTHGLLESYIFFASHFSPEWDRQTAFKFNMDLDVLLNYRLIPRTYGLLGYTATFGTAPTNRFFWAFFFAFTDAYDMKVLVSRYQSIDMHCIALPVKFDDGLSISFLRKKQFFTKKRGGIKSIHFQKKFQLSNISIPENVPSIFLASHFSPE